MATPSDGRAVAAAGIVVWLASLALLPAPLAARILLLAPLVIIPRLLALIPDRRWVGGFAGWPAFAAALPLLVAFALPSGPLAAVFVLPWLALAAVGALAAVLHGLPHLPAILRPGAWADLGIDVALGFWAVAAIFTIIDRLGLDTGFSTTIVLLTATHFHFAGFGLLGLASLLARRRPWLRGPVAGLMVGIPLTALGFVLVSDAINAVGALVVGSSGIGVGIGLLTATGPGVSRWRRAAGVALLVGMPMGIAWSVAIPRRVDLPRPRHDDPHPWRAERHRRPPRRGRVSHRVPVKVVLSGGSGLIGRAICRALIAAGHEPVVLTRDPGGADRVPAVSERSRGTRRDSARGRTSWAMRARSSTSPGRASADGRGPRGASGAPREPAVGDAGARRSHRTVAGGPPAGRPAERVGHRPV